MSEQTFRVAHGSDTEKSVISVHSATLSTSFNFDYICSVALNQLQQLVLFLTPYLEVFGVPIQYVADPRVEHFHNRLQENFADYTFAKFVADVANGLVFVALLPLLIIVSELRKGRGKVFKFLGQCRIFVQHACETVGIFLTLLYEQYDWLSSTLKQGIGWSFTTYEELYNGDITWKQIWNDTLNKIEDQFRKGVNYFGPQSIFTSVIKICRIGDMLQMLRFDHVKKNE